MTDKLREAAKEVVLMLGKCDLRNEPYHRACFSTVRVLEAALVEPEEPKVERVTLCDYHHYDTVGCAARSVKGYDGWAIYAERPIPAKSKAEELARRLVSVATADDEEPLRRLLSEAAAELRRLGK